MKEQELTDMLIHALENSHTGFNELKHMFNECADAFEIGDDVKRPHCHEPDSSKPGRFL